MIEGWGNQGAGADADMNGQLVTAVVVAVIVVTLIAAAVRRYATAAPHSGTTGGPGAVSGPPADALTGLPGREAFLATVAARLRTGPVAVLLVDLGGLRSVNHTMGLECGDDLLRRAAGCLRAAAGPGDSLARLGGTEFAVLTGSG